MRAVTLALALIASATSAFAGDLLGLGGAVYGDERGCKDPELKDYSEEPILVLRGDGYRTFVSGCEFVSVATTRNGDRIVTGLCGSEGDGNLTIEFLRIAKVEGADAYELFSAAGDGLGQAGRCSP